MNDVTIAIPTFNRYDLLNRLCYKLIQDESNIFNIRLFVIDNGGCLIDSGYLKSFDRNNPRISIEVVTPNYNLGVAGSWNYFVKELGSCIVANDDVVFTSEVISDFYKAADNYPNTIIFENSKANEGFSTFFINKPDELLGIGGFDEIFNPAYFEDDDCRYRLKLLKNPVVKVKLDRWAHENSSTLKNASNEYKRNHLCLYLRNKQYYILKWGGRPGKEKFLTPFGNPIDD